MKKMLLTVIFAFIGFWVFSQQKPVVAVAPFNAISGITTEDANVITGIFYNRLGNTNIVTLVNRSIVERVITEHQFQLGDWSNAQKTAELGEALNADWIVCGEIARLGSNIIVNVQFYDIRTFQFKGGADIPLANVNEAYDKMTPLVDSLVQTIVDTGGANRTYDIGDTGPAGGIIFYDKGIFSNGWRYLEAAPVETEFTAPWWDGLNQYVRGTETVVGRGKQNTALIAEQLGQRGEKGRGRAAQLCENVNFNGYNDWFLPSRDELELMYWNLKRKGLGDFGNNIYWSSSEYPSNGGDKAWYQYFVDGSQNGSIKYLAFSVRAVRAF